MTISRREMKLYRRKVIRPLGASSLSPPLSPCAATGREFDCVDDDLCGAVCFVVSICFVSYVSTTGVAGVARLGQAVSALQRVNEEVERRHAHEAVQVGL